MHLLLIHPLTKDEPTTLYIIGTREMGITSKPEDVKQILYKMYRHRMKLGNRTLVRFCGRDIIQQLQAPTMLCHTTSKQLGDTSRMRCNSNIAQSKHYLGKGICVEPQQPLGKPLVAGTCYRPSRWCRYFVWRRIKRWHRHAALVQLWRCSSTTAM